MCEAGVGAEEYTVWPAVGCGHICGEGSCSAALVQIYLWSSASPAAGPP